MITYKCSKCNLAVIVLPNEEPITACKCNAAIIAEIQANVEGHANLSIK